MPSNSIQIISTILLTTQVIFFSSCSKSGLYSIIVTNPGVQHESNATNDLVEPYHKKQIVVPSSITYVDGAARESWSSGLAGQKIHTASASVKATAGAITIKATACDKGAIGIIGLEKAEIRKGGKFIEIGMKYGCSVDNSEVIQAATAFYLIDASKECPEGIHTMEFMFHRAGILKDMADARLKRVIAVCADP